MRHFLRLAPLVGFLPAFAAVACSGQAGPTDTIGSAQASLLEPGPESSRLDWIEATLAGLALSPAQKTTVNALFDRARERRATAATAGLALRDAVATEVRAGKIDLAALEPELGALTLTLNAKRAGDLDALVKLHDVLDAAERNQFADAVEAHGKGARGKHAGLHRLKQWAAALGLTDVQQAEIRAAIGSARSDADGGPRRHFETMRGKRHEIVQAFRGPELTVAEIEPLLGNDDVGPRLARRLASLATTLPFLTETQRKLAAEQILAMPGNL